MADSTLDMTGEEAPEVGLGHGTRALGPSDSSDSGSDVVGGPGMDEGLSDEQSRQMPMTTRGHAGRDLGDVDLDSDSDRAGTGERSSAGLESPDATDRMTTVRMGADQGADEFDDPDAMATPDAGDEVDVAPEQDDGFTLQRNAADDDAAVADGAT